MNGRGFIDTNLLVYAISTDAVKAARAAALLLEEREFVISTQVVNEFVHTCQRKGLLPMAQARRAVEDFLLFFELATIGEATIMAAFDLKQRFGFSWYDALIVASALENGCSTLFSEDFQHGLVVDGKLTVQNPFLS